MYTTSSTYMNHTIKIQNIQFKRESYDARIKISESATVCAGSSGPTIATAEAVLAELFSF